MGNLTTGSELRLDWVRSITKPPKNDGHRFRTYKAVTGTHSLEKYVHVNFVDFPVDSQTVQMSYPTQKDDRTIITHIDPTLDRSSLQNPFSDIGVDVD